MFLFTIESLINPKSKQSREFADDNIGGAFVNCYIAFKDFEAAEQLAKFLIKDRGWIPKKRTDAWPLQKRKLRTKKEKQYYAEAIKYGYSLVFHMWPKDAPDANSEFNGKTTTRLKSARSNTRLGRTHH
jgi:hypothetical protein